MSSRWVRYIAGLFCLFSVLIGYWLLAPAMSNMEQDSTMPPLYLTIIVHNEEDMSRGGVPKTNIPDYNGSPLLMHHFASAMRVFAQMASDHGAKINFGSDWTFSQGVTLYEPGFYIDLEIMGHEIDAHAHESFILYHEVHEEIVTAGGSPTHVASGMNETDIQDQLTYFDRHYPEFEILWGVALPGYVAGECTATWVWRPSRDDWTQHDPNSQYIYIGHGELVNSIQTIRQAVEGRRADRVNTLAVFVSPREFKAAAGTEGIDDAWTVSTDSVDYWENRLAWWDGFLMQIAPLIEAGVVQYATLTEIAEAFVTLEDELAFDWEDVPRSDTGMRQRNAMAGYPFE